MIPRQTPSATPHREPPPSARRSLLADRLQPSPPRRAPANDSQTIVFHTNLPRLMGNVKAACRQLEAARVRYDLACADPALPRPAEQDFFAIDDAAYRTAINVLSQELGRVGATESDREAVRTYIHRH